MLARSIGTHACMFAHANTYSNIFRCRGIEIKWPWKLCGYLEQYTCMHTCMLRSLIEQYIWWICEWSSWRIRLPHVAQVVTLLLSNRLHNILYTRKRIVGCRLGPTIVYNGWRIKGLCTRCLRKVTSEMRGQLYSMHQYMQCVCMHGAEFSIHAHMAAI